MKQEAKKTAKTRVWTITCPECKLEFYSRARHDYRVCGCPSNTMVDGGFSGYVRYGGKDVTVLRDTFRHRFVKATKQELFDDWSHRQSKFGVIVGRKGAK